MRSSDGSSSSSSEGEGDDTIMKSPVYRDQSDYVCLICEKEGNLLLCDGPCLSSFHLKCLGMNKLPSSDKWLCPHCKANSHPCFHCNLPVVHMKKSSDSPEIDGAQCSARSCGKFYHYKCVLTLPLTRPIGKGTSSFICPLHTCASLGDCKFKNESTSTAPVIRCTRCPTTYHKGCIPPDTKYKKIMPHRMICGKHDQSTRPKSADAIIRKIKKKKKKKKKLKAEAAALKKRLEEEEAKRKSLVDALGNSSDEEEEDVPPLAKQPEVVKEEKKPEVKPQAVPPAPSEPVRPSPKTVVEEKKVETKVETKVEVFKEKLEVKKEVKVSEKKVVTTTTTTAAAASSATTAVAVPKPSRAAAAAANTKIKTSKPQKATAKQESPDEASVEWVQCDACKKWRTVSPDISADSLPEHWFCKMNTWNADFASCSAPSEVTKKRSRKTSGTASTISLSSLRDLQWVQCEKQDCSKWRSVPSNYDLSKLPEQWFCKMNTWNPHLNHCDIENPPEINSFLKKTKSSKDVSKPVVERKKKVQNAPHNWQWVQCEVCSKWRRLAPFINIKSLPSRWVCKMNNWDVTRAYCHVEAEADDSSSTSSFSNPNAWCIASSSSSKASKLCFRELIFNSNGLVRKEFVSDKANYVVLAGNKRVHRDSQYSLSHSYTKAKKKKSSASSATTKTAAGGNNICVILDENAHTELKQLVINTLKNATSTKTAPLGLMELTVALQCEKSMTNAESSKYYSFQAVETVLNDLVKESVVEKVQDKYFRMFRKRPLKSIKPWKV